MRGIACSQLGGVPLGGGGGGQCTLRGAGRRLPFSHMGSRHAEGLRWEEHPASPLINMFSETGEVAEFGVTVTALALGQAAQGITVFIEGARDLIDRPGLVFFVSFCHMTQHGSPVK